MADTRQRSSLARFMLRPESDHVRMGPISLLALVIIIALAVLAVLAFSTANASSVLSQRQADAVAASYANERAAQEFVAGLDDVLAGVRGEPTPATGSAAQAVEQALGSLCEAAQRAGDVGQSASAAMEGNVVSATFSTGDGKALDIRVTVREDGTYQVDSWKMSAVYNEEQPEGRLFVADKA